jgi:hypothetical protein
VVKKALPVLPLSAPERLALERGHAGDLTALAEVRDIFDRHPELVEHVGNLAEHAKQAVLGLVAGSSLVGREAVARQADLLRQELLGDGASVLEKLLAERVALSWVWVHQADLELVEHLKQRPDSLACRAAQKRLDAAQKRYLAAIRGLNPVPIHEIAERWIGKFERGRLRILADLKDKLEGETDA